MANMKNNGSSNISGKLVNTGRQIKMREYYCGVSKTGKDGKFYPCNSLKVKESNLWSTKGFAKGCYLL